MQLWQAESKMQHNEDRYKKEVTYVNSVEIRLLYL